MAEVSDVVAAVDVGGTRIKAALVTAACDTLAAVTTLTPNDIAADIGAVVHATVTELLAETRLGAARGARHALFLPIGTGIAGALLLDGAVITADGRAGELGHLVIDPAGPACGCGATGCLEAIASAAAVEREYSA